MVVASRQRRNVDDEFFWDGNEIAVKGDDSAMQLFYVAPDAEGETGDDKDAVTSTGDPVVVEGTSSNALAEEDENEEETRRIYHDENDYGVNTKAMGSMSDVCPIFFCRERLSSEVKETHDNYFLTALKHQRSLLKNENEAMGQNLKGEGTSNSPCMVNFRCLEENCNATFGSDSSRMSHLIKYHGYPVWFRFHYHPGLSFAAKKQSAIISSSSETKTNRRRRKKGHATSLADVKEESSMQEDIKESKKKERKKRQKEKRATVPCRFYLAGHCRYGDRCMFLHEMKSNNGQNNQENQKTMDDEDEGTTLQMIADTDTEEKVGSDKEAVAEMEIDSLTRDMERKAKVTVPTKISFGRRRRQY